MALQFKKPGLRFQRPIPSESRKRMAQDVTQSGTEDDTQMSLSEAMTSESNLPGIAKFYNDPDRHPLSWRSILHGIIDPIEEGQQFLETGQYTMSSDDSVVGNSSIQGTARMMAANVTGVGPAIRIAAVQRAAAAQKKAALKRADEVLGRVYGRGSSLDPVLPTEIDQITSAYVIRDMSADIGRQMIKDYKRNIRSLHHTSIKPEAVSAQYMMRVKELDGGRVFTDKDYAERAAWFDKRLKEETNRPFLRETGTGPDGFLARHEALVEAQEQATRITGRKIAKKIRQFGPRWIWDRSGNVKNALKEVDPKLGEIAQMKFELASGYHTRAADTFQRARDEIFQDLSPDDAKELGALILARAGVAKASYRYSTPVDKSKPIQEKTIFGATADDMSKAQDLIAERLGSQGKYLDFQERANKYYITMYRQLSRLYEKGIITGEEFDKMRTIAHSPFMVHGRGYRGAPVHPDDIVLDPIEKVGFAGRQRGITVASSGIKPLSAKDIKALETDPEALLEQVIVRTEARIARNNANIGLRNVAIAHPSNDVVWTKPHVRDGFTKEQIKKWPKGRDDWVTMSVRVGGRNRQIRINPDYYNEWDMNPILAGASTRMIGWLTGSSVVKALATGIEPTFALTNFPRDVQYVWKATDLYSTFGPKAALQIGEDLAEVMSDAVLRRGLYEKFIEYGGGQEFLTMQGLPGSRGKGQRLIGKAQRTAYDAAHALAFLNSTSEVSVRLAVMNKALKAGMDTERAVWEARRVIDFNQGGIGAKAGELLFPYLNASIQGTRGYVRAYKKHPYKTFAKDMQLAMVFGGVYLANQELNADGWRDTSDDVKNRNVVIFRGPNDFWIDDKGQKRFVGVKIPLDQNSMWIKGAVDALMDKHFYDRDPAPQMLAAIREQVMLVPDAPISPFGQAVVEYLSNYDIWRDRAIWPGREEIEPEAEIMYPPNQPTSQFPIDVGTTLGMSPARLQGAAENVIPANSIFAKIFGGSYNLAFSDIPPELISAYNTEELLPQLPGFSRFLFSTHPYSPEAEAFNETTLEIGTANFTQRQTLSRMIFEEQKGITSRTDTMKWIRSQPLEEQKRLREQYDTQEALTKTFAQMPDLEGFPSRTWWENIRSQPLEERAGVFLSMYSGASPEVKTKMRSFSYRVPGFATDGFKKQLRIQARKLGYKYP